LLSTKLKVKKRPKNSKLSQLKNARKIYPQIQLFIHTLDRKQYKYLKNNKLLVFKINEFVDN